jgi:hypothetical protein
MATETDAKGEAKKFLAEQADKRAKDAEERAKKRGKPTPTQTELDLAALGHHPDLEPDGSPPDPHNTGHRQMQADPAVSYQTRHMSSVPRPQRPEQPRA